MANGYVNPSSEGYTPYSSTSGMGLPPVAQMGLDFMIAQMGSPYGSLPFQGGRSYTDTKREQAFTEAHRAAMVTAGKADQQGLIEMARGAAAIAGYQWTSELQANAEWGANLWTSQYGWLSGNPAATRFADNLLGGRSALPLAHTMHTAGRQQYDPTTGASHMSGASSAAIAEGLQRTFYGDMQLPDGTIIKAGEAGFSRSRGLAASEMAGLYGHLSSRGQMPGTLDYSSAYDLGTETGQRKALGEHTSRVAETLRDRAGAMQAMKELFDDPNAPIPQMLASMEALTGGTQQITPQRAEMLVRGLKEAAKGAQVTVEGLLMVSQQSEQITNSLGLNRAFGAPITGTGLNTMEALQRTGAMGHGYWGQSDIDTVRAKEQARLGRGYASDFANSAGALGELLSSLPNDGRSAAARQLYRDMQSGSTNTAAFRQFSVMSREEQINWVAQNTGLSASEVASQFDATTMNQGRVYKDALGSAVLDAQRVEFGQKVLGRSFANTTNTMLSRLGAATPQLNDMLTKAGTESLMNMDQATRANDSTRYGTMASSMYDRLKQAAAGGDTQAAQLLQRLGAEQGGATGALYRVAQQSYGIADTEMGGGLADYLTAMSPEVEAERRNARARTKQQALEGYSMAGLVEGSWARRLTRSLREAGMSEKGGGSIKKILQDTLHIETSDKTAERLGGLLWTTEKAAEDLMKLRDADLKPGENESPEAYQQRLASHKREVGRLQTTYDQRAKDLRAIIDSDPKLKASYEQFERDIKPGGGQGEGGADTKIENANLSAAQLNFRVDSLVVNGQVIKDATGTGRTKEPARGRAGIA